MNPFKGLLKSRKFWLLVLDMVIALTVIFVTEYAETSLELTVAIIAAFQPVFIFAIGGIAFEDGMAKLHGNHQSQI